MPKIVEEFLQRTSPFLPKQPTTKHLPLLQDDELGETNVCVPPSPEMQILTLFCNRLANVAGTQEPIYGPSAIQSVATQAETTPYTELTKDDVKWQTMDSTCVETQSFYLIADSGHIALVQIIYSNVACATKGVCA